MGALYDGLAVSIHNMLSKLLPNDLALPSWLNQLQVRDDISEHWQRNIVFGILGASVVWFIWKRYDNRNLPPGPIGWPIVGSKRLLEGDKFTSGLDQLVRKYGEIFSVHNGTLQIYLNSHSVIKEALVQHGDVFACRPQNFLSSNHLMELQDDIFSTPYQTPGWNENKSRLTSSLRAAGFGKSGGVEDQMLEQIELLIPYLDKLAQKNEPLNFAEILPKATTNVIFQVLVNKKYELDDPRLAEVCEKIMDWMGALLSDSHFYLMTLPKFWINLFYRKSANEIKLKTNALRAVIREEIEEHKLTFNPEEPRDFIDVYLKKIGDGHSMERMVDNVMFFLPDAVDTMSLQITWLLLYLTRYDKVQRKMVEEIQTATGGNRCITWADRPQLPYTEATIMEITRLEPVFGITPPHAVSKEIIFRGYRIPVDIVVNINVRGAMRDPKVFEKPDEFNPDRFLDEDGCVIKNDHWIPFGMGRRKCPGEQITRMETFLMVANIIQKYQLTFPNGECPSLDKSKSFMSIPPDFKVKLTTR